MVPLCAGLAASCRIELIFALSDWREVDPFGTSRAMQLFVGLSSHRGNIKRFGFDILELSVSPSLPKRKTMVDMRATRPDIRFSLRLSPDVVAKGPEHPDIERAVVAAEALQADVIVIPSGPRFTPTAHHRALLKSTCDALRGETRKVAWEPRGVWAPEEAEEWAQEVEALLVRDLTREQSPGTETVYTRLLPFGFGARVSQNSIETLAGQLESAETAYVVVQGEGAKMTRTQLREWFELEDE